MVETISTCELWRQDVSIVYLTITSVTFSSNKKYFYGNVLKNLLLKTSCRIIHFKRESRSSVSH